MIQSGRQRFTAYVIFQGAEHRRFWRIFTGKGWRHCLVVIPFSDHEPSLISPTYSLIINPITCFVRVETVFEEPLDVVQQYLDAGYTAAIGWQVDHDYKHEYIPRGLLTCVSLVKALIGVSAWYVWTPKHLGRYLLRNGGELIRKVK